MFTAPRDRRAAPTGDVYRARLGEPGAGEAARSLAAEAENPALDDLLATVG